MRCRKSECALCGCGWRGSERFCTSSPELHFPKRLGERRFRHNGQPAELLQRRWNGRERRSAGSTGRTRHSAAACQQGLQCSWWCDSRWTCCTGRLVSRKLDHCESAVQRVELLLELRQLHVSLCPNPDTMAADSRNEF